MELPLNAQAIIDHNQKLIGPSATDYNEASNWKKAIMSNQRNLFTLIQLFMTYDFDALCQLFVVKTMKEFIESYYSSLPLYEIQKQLWEMPIEKIKSRFIVKYLAEVIALITRLIYQQNDEYTLSVDDDKDTLTDLEGLTYAECAIAFDKSRQEISHNRNMEIQVFFTNNALVPYICLSLRSVSNNTYASLELLYTCLKYRQKLGNSLLFFPPEIVERITDLDFMYFLLEIARGPDDDSACSALSVISLFSRAECIVHNNECSNVILFIITEILKTEELIKNSNRLPKIIEIFDSSCCATDEFLNFLIDFSIEWLQNDFCTAHLFLYSLLGFYTHMTKTHSNKELAHHFCEILHTYITSGLDSFASDAQSTYDCIFEDASSKGTTKLISLLMVQSDEVLAEETHFIADAMLEIVHEEISIEVNCQLGFLLLFARSAIKNPNIYKCNDVVKQSFDHIITNAMEVLRLTNDIMGEIINYLTESSYPFPMELSMIRFIRMYIKQYFVDYKSTRPTPIEKIVPFDNKEQAAEVLFTRVWKDVLSSVCVDYANSTIKRILDVTIFRKCINHSPIAKTFLHEYMEFPCRSIVCFVLGHVLIPVSHDSTPEYMPAPSKETRRKTQFLNSLIENFSGEMTTEQIRRLFKIWSWLFKASTSQTDWRELYIFFCENFSQLCMEHAHTENSKVVLKFLYRLMSNTPVSNPFRAPSCNPNMPHAFQMYRFVTSLLVEISVHLLENLPRIDVDDSIFDAAVSPGDIFEAPISLTEARDIGLDKRQSRLRNDVLSIVRPAEEGNWVNIPIILDTAYMLMKSPVPNFGIVKYYNDVKIFDLLDIVITAMDVSQTRSMLTLLAIPQLVEKMAMLLNEMMKQFGDTMVSVGHYMEFIMHFTRVAFLSHRTDAVKNNCAVLEKIIGIIEQPLVEKFKSQFVLALQLVLFNNNVPEASNFLIEFFKRDNAFFHDVMSSIYEDITTDETKEVFDECAEALEADLPSPESPEYDEYFRGNFEEFSIRMAPYRIRLNTLPSMEQYFTFL